MEKKSPVEEGMIGVVNTECMRREGKRQQKCMKALGVYDTVGRFVAAVCAKVGSCEMEKCGDAEDNAVRDAHVAF